MIKTVHGMHGKEGMSIEDLHHNWFENHGPIVATAPLMVRYVQNITLPESYHGDPKPTHEGASMTWFETLNDLWHSWDSGGWQVQIVDAPNWFSRDRGATFAAAKEQVIVDGVANATQVKMIVMTVRADGVSLEDFHRRWLDEHGPIGAALPGVRRYVQNHSLPESYGHEGWAVTHDGWSEMWFDNLAELQAAYASDEAKRLYQDDTLFNLEKTGIVVARERAVVVEPRS
jgi:uncharacterized protein (TIGR02118 family)